MKKHKWKLTHNTYIGYFKCEDCSMCISLNEEIIRNETDCDERIAENMTHRLLDITSHPRVTISIKLFDELFEKFMK